MSESEVDLFHPDDVAESDVNYFWFIAFEWDLLQEEPFQIFVRQYFGNEDIPDTWFTGVLSDKNRAVQLELNAVAGNNKYSIFAKVEKGIHD